MVRYISEIITRDDLYLKMSEKSLEYVAQHNIHKTVESFERIYEIHTGKAKKKLPFRLLDNA